MLYALSVWVELSWSKTCGYKYEAYKEGIHAIMENKFTWIHFFLNIRKVKIGIMNESVCIFQGYSNSSMLTCLHKITHKKKDAHF